MDKIVSYSEVRANLAKLWDEVVDHQEILLLKRRGKEDVAMISANELSALLESIHLIRSPKNAKRLLGTVQKARENKGEVGYSDASDPPIPISSDPLIPEL